MARSKLTISELKAQAMLLGLKYDAGCHLFYFSSAEYVVGRLVDPETLEERAFDGRYISDRSDALKRGEIGAADA